MNSKSEGRKKTRGERNRKKKRLSLENSPNGIGGSMKKAKIENRGRKKRMEMKSIKRFLVFSLKL